MKLFSRRTTKEKVGKLILEFVKTKVPNDIIVTETLTMQDKSGITLINKSSGISFELDFEDVEIDELSEIDKDHLIQTIIIPALKKIDQDLFKAHKEIEKTIKELKG